jgi:superfamily I DNA/RNA helicase
VEDRVIKNWNPKEDEGIVQRHSLLFNNHIDFTKGEWLILARTNYMLDPIMDRLRDNGLFYQFKNRSSISEKMISAIQGWKSLQERQDIDLATAQNIYYYMKGNSNIEHGYKEKIKTADNEVMYNYESLSTHHGLRTDINTEWNFALDTIPDKMQRYINAALLRSSFNKSKNIKLSTIHASKGGEADNVVVLTDLPRKADLSISQKRDDERRVFYVATTRAKKSLHIIASKTNREFKELL